MLSSYSVGYCKESWGIQRLTLPFSRSVFWQSLLKVSRFSRVFLLTIKHEMKTTQAVGIGWSAQTTVLGSLCWTRRQGTWVLVPVVRLLRNNLFPRTFTFVIYKTENGRWAVRKLLKVPMVWVRLVMQQAPAPSAIRASNPDRTLTTFLGRAEHRS